VGKNQKKPNIVEAERKKKKEEVELKFTYITVRPGMSKSR
jgi:hypothetical protein